VFAGNEMKKIEDVSVIWSLIFSSKELSRQAYVWRFIGDSKHVGMVKIEAVRKQRNDFCIIPSDGQAKMVESLLSGNEGKIDLYIPEASMIMRCDIKHADAPRRYYLCFPSYSALLERRKYLRLNVYESGSIKANFSKSIVVPRYITQYFDKTLTDISVGGFSFYVSKIENKFFQVGDPITGVSIKTFDWSGQLEGEVTSIREIQPDEFNGLSYKVWRVSCKFRNMQEDAKRYIERYILERIKRDLSAINS